MVNLNVIKLKSEQIDELLKICDKYCSSIPDGIIATEIYEKIFQNNVEYGSRYARFRAAATVLRTGYIMGQRAERERLKKRVMNKYNTSGKE